MTASQPADQSARDTIRDEHGRTLFVEAGAGTGKTTALVARVVEMVARGHLEDMSQLAAITFTENAAAELRSRIREALETAARGSFRGRDYDAAHRQRCAEALGQLDEATISTLHGFAARILSEVPLEAGLPPGFEVSDAITSQLDRRRAWRSFLDRLLSDDSVADHVLAGLTLGMSLDRLRELAGTFAANWDQLVSRPFVPQPMPSLATTAVVVPMERAVSALPQAPDDDTLTTHLEETVAPALDELRTLREQLDVLEALRRLKLSPKAGNAGKWKSFGGKAHVTEALLEAQEAQQRLLSQAGVAVTETLCAHVQYFVLEEAKRHRCEGRLDFHDLLVLTRRVLRDDRDVRARMHQRFTVLMVDEFQDTDPLQVEIVCLIAGECGDIPPSDWEQIPIPDGRLFFVGDPKQSIYRFRRADVSLFDRTGELHAAGHTLLQVNFRSVPGVLDAVNQLFGELIGKSTVGQVPYSALQSHRVVTENASPVTLIGGPADMKAVALREREAEHIAATIRRAKAEGWKVERERHDRRPSEVSYADMALLLPARTSLPAIESALQKADIPYRVESRSLVWGTDAVRDVITLLQAVVNPADEVAILAALRHHGLACSDRHLLEWAVAGGRWSYTARNPDGIDSTHPVAAGMAALRRWHDLRWWLPVNHLVEQIIRELRLPELTAELRRPRDHWRRLRFVVDQARAFCDSGGAGLAEFVAWAVEQIESEADVLETVVPEPDDDSVRILTVHGSKGLEFPVTILAGLGVAPRSGAEVFWAGAKPEARLKSDTLQTAEYASRKGSEKELDLAESVRLLYVAMTRAKDRLVVGCYHKPVKSDTPSHAQQIWALLCESSLVNVEAAAPRVHDEELSPSRVSAAAPGREAFLSARAELLAGVLDRVAASATSLVSEGEAAAVSFEAKQGAGAATESRAGRAESPPRAVPSWIGTAIGSAVHGALELVDLTGSDETEIHAVSVLLCEQLDIPHLVDEVARRVRNALTSRVVADAGAAGRFWREVYVVSQDGERYVEGYVDLLVEEHDGLVVVDYKTDRATTEAERAEKTLHYRPQLRAYAAALRQVPGLNVSKGTLLFLGADGAAEVETDIDDRGGGTHAGTTPL